MKKFTRGLIASILVLSVFFTRGTDLVRAEPSSGGATGVAPGSWTTGTEITIDLEKTPAPYAWVQLLEKGVVITEPGKICHPFRGGQYKWIPDIRQLISGKWMKLDTTQEWIPSEEGMLMACAQAPAAGTYALFGYYTGPKEAPPQTCFLNTTEWKADIYQQHLEVDFPADFPLGLVVTYEIIESTYLDPATTDFSGTTTTYDDYGWTYATWFDNDLNPLDPTWSATILIEVSGCTVEMPVDTYYWQLPT